MKGRAESCGHKKRGGDGRDVPTVSLGHVCVCGEQGEEEEKGTPIIVVKDNRATMLMAEVVPNKGVNDYTVDVPLA